MGSVLDNWPEESNQSTARDDLEDTLLQAHSLIESAVSRHRVHESGDMVVGVAPDCQSTVAAAEQLARNARRELVSVVSQNCMSTVGPGIIKDMLSALSKKGVRVRLLCAPEIVEISREKWFIESVMARFPIRVAEFPPQELMIVDGDSALIHSTIHPTERQAIILHDHAIVDSLYTLFNSVWTLASPIMRRPSTVDRRYELESQILACLDRGQTDEAAARKVGISVRTYRRYVAKIMQDVGASSRFQAGALASKLGLINACDHSYDTRFGKT